MTQGFSEQDEPNLLTPEVLLRVKRPLSEIRDAVERAYHSDELREKFELYLKVTEIPKGIPKNLWNTRLLFCDEYKLLPEKRFWCTLCKIRKVISEKHTKCFFCHRRTPVYRQLNPANKSSGSCSFIYSVRGKDHPFLNRNPDKFLPGARCGERTFNGGNYCKTHQHHFQWNLLHRKEHPEIFEAKIYLPETPEMTEKQERKKYPMPDFYRGLGKTVSSYVKEVAGLDAAQIFDVRQELALARAAVAPYAQKFGELEEWFEVKAPGLKVEIERIRNKGQTQTEGDKALLNSYCAILAKAETNRALAAKDLQSSLVKIVELTDKASTIYLRHVNVVDMNHMKRVVNEIFRGLYETLGAEEGQRVEVAIRQLVALPENDNLLTVSPDSLLREMVKRMGVLPTITAEAELVSEETSEDDSIPDVPDLDETLRRVTVTGK